uniref:adenosine deaminase n=1 Tax=Caligus rogercresseyi TaxID=217165 RepID=C1BPU3_CALRO|nr:Adenosine deaminase [Caligus rogercresseyi]
MPAVLPSSIGPSLKTPLSRVELHVHLDGSPRHETLWELTKIKKKQLPGDGSFKAFQKAIVVNEPSNLAHYLASFAHIMPAISGDIEALERVAYEFGEDSFTRGVLYVESRFCPQLLLNKEEYPTVSSEDILKAVLRGFKKAETEFGIKIRTILACIQGAEVFDQEILDFCTKYKDEGVVGIDHAGDEAQKPNAEGRYRNSSVITVFQEAKRRGIHRTAHAGESGPPGSIEEALDAMYAERIGHGYRVLHDKTLYERCIREGVHFETCPISSYLTGGVPLSTHTHPIITIAQDRANFSVNSDDTAVNGCGLEEDFDIVKAWGLKEAHLVRATFNAARAAFLPSHEKKELLTSLKATYGIE